MPRYVLPDKRMHLFTRLSVILIIAPYMFYVGMRQGDCLLQGLALGLLLFDLWSLLAGDLKGGQIHQWARLVALVVQVPYMLYAGLIYNDRILILLAILTGLADAYTFYLGLQN